MLYFPTGFVLGLVESQFVMSAAALESFSSLDLGITSVRVSFTVFLSCRKSVKEKIGRRKKKVTQSHMTFIFTI